MTRLFAATLLLAASTPAAAADWEASAWVGPSFPFYEQSFSFDPGALDVPFPEATIRQRSVYSLDGRGGVSLGLSLARQGRIAGVEARLDTADVHVETRGAQYDVSARLPAPIGAVSTVVDLGTGTGDLARLTPLSLNVRLRAPGRLAPFASAGLSYLPGFRFVIRQRIGAALPFVGGSGLDVAEVEIPAEAVPGEEDGEGRFGWNAGAGLRQTVSPRVALAVEGRYFSFQRQTLHWGAPRGSSALPALQREIVRQVTSRLEPVRFNPAFFQAVAAVSLRF